MSDNILKNFSTNYKEVLVKSINLAWELKTDIVKPEYLLYCLLKQKGSIGAEILSKAKLPKNNLTAILKPNKTTKKSKDFPGLDSETVKIIEKSAILAYSYNHPYVATEHLLLALVKKIPTVANRVLNNLGINLAKIPAEIEVSINQQPNIESGESGLTSAAKKAIELSIMEKKRLGGGKVQPEHILIGLIRQDEGVAANFFENLGINAERIYIELIRLHNQSLYEQ